MQSILATWVSQTQENYSADSNSAKGQPPLLHRPAQRAHAHNVHVPVLCAFKAIHQRSRSVESSHSTQMFFLLQDHKSWGDESSSEGRGGASGDRIFTTEVMCKVEANSDCRISQNGKDNLHRGFPQEPLDKLFKFCVIQGKSVIADVFGYQVIKNWYGTHKKTFSTFSTQGGGTKGAIECVSPNFIR